MLGVHYALSPHNYTSDEWCYIINSGKNLAGKNSNAGNMDILLVVYIASFKESVSSKVGAKILGFQHNTIFGGQFYPYV